MGHKTFPKLPKSYVSNRMKIFLGFLKNNNNTIFLYGENDNHKNKQTKLVSASMERCLSLLFS